MLDLVPKCRLTFDDLVNQETKILTTLQFDVQWATPVFFVQRFAQLLKLDDDSQFSQVVCLVLKFMSANGKLWLDHHPGLQAAVAVNIAMDLVNHKSMRHLVTDKRAFKL